eukprot:scaffold34928_cov54-Attheya_sp.AAC.2
MLFETTIEILEREREQCSRPSLLQSFPMHNQQLLVLILILVEVFRVDERVMILCRSPSSIGQT